MLYFKLSGVRVGIVVVIAVQNHMSAQCAYRVDLDRSCCLRHDYDCANAALLRRERDTLGMIACRAADDAAG